MKTKETTEHSSTVITVIQARTSSQRLPNKVLKTVDDLPMLQYVIDRARRAKMVSETIVATSKGTDDDPVEALCKQIKLKCFRGSLENVASRFLDAIKPEDCEAFVRVSGDSPLIDPALIDTAIKIYREQEADVVTNVHPRTFPKGQSVEVVRKNTFIRAYDLFETDTEMEHVTQHFYDHIDMYRVVNFENPEQLGHLNLSVDTIDDFEFFRKIIAMMTKPHCEYSLEELLALASSLRTTPHQPLQC
jgi:spore coat polysaccharide biosynthesis protein SpsF